jgi:hypothetical protein
MDDAELFCFSADDSTQVIPKARALGSLHVLKLLQSNDFPSWDFKNVVSAYLTSAEMKLNKVLAATLRASKNGNNNNNNTDTNNSSDEKSRGNEVLQSSMISLISLLQKIIVDLYYLFVKKIKIDDNKNEVTGLVAFSFYDFIGCFHSSIINDGNHHPHNRIHSAWLAKYSLIPSTYEIQDLLRKWLNEKLRYVTEHCSKLLSSLTSAVQVASLQQSVYIACNFPSEKEENNSYFTLPASDLVFSSSAVGKGLTFQSAWLESVSTLLSSGTSVNKYRQQSAFGKSKENKEKKSVSSSSSASYLWTTVFRVSFLKQIERLLHHSCNDILERIHHQIIWCLKSYGVEIGRDNHRVSFHCNNAAVSPSSIGYFADMMKNTFFDSLSQLLDDVITPVSLCLVFSYFKYCAFSFGRFTKARQLSPVAILTFSVIFLQTPLFQGEN